MIKPETTDISQFISLTGFGRSLSEICAGYVDVTSGHYLSGRAKA